MAVRLPINTYALTFASGFVLTARNLQKGTTQNYQGVAKGLPMVAAKMLWMGLLVTSVLHYLPRSAGQVASPVPISSRLWG